MKIASAALAVLFAVLTLGNIAPAYSAETDAQATAGLPSAKEQVQAVKAMSEDEIRTSVLEQADRLEAVAKAPAKEGVAISEQTRSDLLVLAEGMREQAQQPGLKKKIVRNLKRGGKGVLVGLGWAGFATYEVAMSPIFGFVGLIVGLTGEKVAMNGEGGILGVKLIPSQSRVYMTPELVSVEYAIAFTEGTITTAAGLIGIGAAVSAEVVNGLCVQSYPKAGTASATFCEGAAIIDKYTVRATMAGASRVGLGINKSVRFVARGVKKVFHRKKKELAVDEQQVAPSVGVELQVPAEQTVGAP